MRNQLEPAVWQVAWLLICAGSISVVQAEWGPEVPPGAPMSVVPDVREPPIPGPSIAVEPPPEPALAFGESLAAQPAGALAGIVVYCSAGHGFGANAAETQWVPERPLLHGLNEDIGNLDQLNAFAEQAWRAGATVVPFRPVGYQTNEVVLDNTQTNLSATGQVVFSGAWADTAQTNFYYGQAGAVGYRYARVSPTGPTAWAVYQPDLPAAGQYPVYTWLRSGSDRANQRYRIQHSGGLTDVRVDHSQVGLGWVWLGNYHFNSGTNGWVTIANDDPAGSTNDVVIADAIRFGNGMGSTARGTAGVSGFESELESSRFWTIKSLGVGFATSLYDLAGFDDREDNIGQPARMAVNMCRTNGWPRWRRLYVGFHSNAGSGTARGVWALGDSRLETNAAYAAFFQGQTNLGMRMARRVQTNMLAGVAAGIIPSWTATFRSTTYNSTYGEIYNSYNAVPVYQVMDTTILEVAFHDNADDALVLKTPAGRQGLARAAVQGIVDHLSQFYAGSAVPAAYAPDAPETVQAIQTASGTVTVAWTLAAPNAASGDAPAGFRVYTSADGRGFGNPVEVPGGAVRSCEISGLAAGTTLFFRVCATNAGGESADSPLAGVRLAGSGLRAEVLVVDGFKRNDATLAPARYFANGLDGQVTLVRPRMINNRDTVREHGLALATAGRAFDSLDAAGVSLAVLTNCSKVVWALGEESTVDETFSAAEQVVVSNYLARGGRLLVSGAEIGWDLGRTNSAAADRAFFSNCLHAAYVHDSGSNRFVTGTTTGFLNSVSIAFNYTNLLADVYAANWPDVLAGTSGAITAAVYGTSAAGANGAIVQYAGISNRTIVMGFPFETITNAATRAAVMTAAMAFFDEGAGAPPVVVIVTPDQAVAAGTTEIEISGTNNAAVTGTMRWTNSLGGAGTFAAAPAWTANVALASGTNLITVTGTNAAGAAASDTVQIVRGLPGAPTTTLIDEPFDAAPAAPTHWVFAGITENYTSVTNCGRAVPSVKFDSDGDSVTTPVFSGGTNVQFWLRANPSAGTVATGVFTVAELSGGTWNPVFALTNPVKTGQIFAVPISPAAVQLRFTWAKVYGNIAFDDVIVNGMWAAAADSDGDGADDHAEYIAGTDPRTNGSVLVVSALAAVTNDASRLVFVWPSAAGRVYSIWQAPHAAAAYTQQVGDIAATAPTNSYTNPAPVAAGTYFYGLRVRWPAAP